MKTTSTPSFSLSDSRASETRGWARITLGENRDFGRACVSLRESQSGSKKRLKGEGEGRRGSFVPLPLPRHSFFFFALVPVFQMNLARKRLLRRLVFPRTMIAEELNKGVLVVYLCACKGTGNKCSYYLVKSCNVAINACKLVFFERECYFGFL